MLPKVIRNQLKDLDQVKAFLDKEIVCEFKSPFHGRTFKVGDASFKMKDMMRYLLQLGRKEGADKAQLKAIAEHLKMLDKQTDEKALKDSKNLKAFLKIHRFFANIGFNRKGTWEKIEALYPKEAPATPEVPKPVAPKEEEKKESKPPLPPPVKKAAAAAPAKPTPPPLDLTLFDLPKAPDAPPSLIGPGFGGDAPVVKRDEEEKGAPHDQGLEKDTPAEKDLEQQVEEEQNPKAGEENPSSTDVEGQAPQADTSAIAEEDLTEKKTNDDTESGSSDVQGEAPQADTFPEQDLTETGKETGSGSTDVQEQAPQADAYPEQDLTETGKETGSGSTDVEEQAPQADAYPEQDLTETGKEIGSGSTDVEEEAPQADASPEHDLTETGKETGSGSTDVEEQAPQADAFPEQDLTETGKETGSGSTDVQEQAPQADAFPEQDLTEIDKQTESGSSDVEEQAPQTDIEKNVISPSKQEEGEEEERLSDVPSRSSTPGSTEAGLFSFPHLSAITKFVKEEKEKLRDSIRTPEKEAAILAFFTKYFSLFTQSSPISEDMQKDLQEKVKALVLEYGEQNYRAIFELMEVDEIAKLSSADAVIEAWSKKIEALKEKQNKKYTPWFEKLRKAHEIACIIASKKDGERLICRKLADGSFEFVGIYSPKDQGVTDQISTWMNKQKPEDLISALESFSNLVASMDVKPEGVEFVDQPLMDELLLKELLELITLHLHYEFQPHQPFVGPLWIKNLCGENLSLSGRASNALGELHDTMPELNKKISAPLDQILVTFKDKVGEKLISDVMERYGLNESEMDAKKFAAFIVGIAANISVEELKNLLRKNPGFFTQGIDGEILLRAIREELTEEDLAKALFLFRKNLFRAFPKGDFVNPHYENDLALLEATAWMEHYIHEVKEDEKGIDLVQSFRFAEHISRDLIYGLMANTPAVFRDGAIVSVLNEKGEFEIKRVVSLISKDGCNGVCLIPISKRSDEEVEIQIAFRGTYDQDSLNRDINPKEGEVKFFEGPGVKSFNENRRLMLENLKKAINEANVGKEQKVRFSLFGHSLGASDAQRMAHFLYFLGTNEKNSGCFSKIDLYGFNPPGVEEGLNTQLEKRIEERKDKIDLNLRYFKTDKDLVQKAGVVLLGGNGLLSNPKVSVSVFHFTIQAMETIFAEGASVFWKYFVSSRLNAHTLKTMTACYDLENTVPNRTEVKYFLTNGKNRSDLEKVQELQKRKSPDTKGDVHLEEIQKLLRTKLEQGSTASGLAGAFNYLLGKK